MALSTQDKLGAANLGLQGLQGLFGGLDSSDDEARQQAEQDQLLMMLLSQIQNQGNVEQDLSAEQLQRAMAMTSANPLGAEMGLKKSNALGRAGLEAFSNRELAGPTDPGILAAMGGKMPRQLGAGFMDRPGVREAYSDANVDEAIRQRRAVTAGIDPRAAQQIDPSNSYANQLFGDLTDSNNSRRSFAQSQTDQVNQRAAATVAAKDDDDGPGFWKKLGGAVLGGAGLAANFIPGVGPLASMGIGALTGAAGGAMMGGKKGAIAGAGIGAGGAAAINQLPGQKASQSAWQGAPYNGPVNGAQPSIPAPANFMNEISQQASGLSQFTPQQPNRSKFTPPTFGVGMQPQPSIQSALSKPPSADEFQGWGFGQNPNQFNEPYRPQFDLSKAQLPQQIQSPRGLPQQPQSFMRAPTGVEKFKDYMSPLMDTMAAFGAGTPSRDPLPIQQVQDTPVGMLASAGVGATGSVPKIGAAAAAKAPRFRPQTTNPAAMTEADILAKLAPSQLLALLRSGVGQAAPTVAAPVAKAAPKAKVSVSAAAKSPKTNADILAKMSPQQRMALLQSGVK